uniref:Uncharacterized protein n=1 Tax=Rhizophora mucronata TaxID=61149 RepID=A0A2P2R1K5_RHIMU
MYLFIVKGINVTAEDFRCCCFKPSPGMIAAIS